MDQKEEVEKSGKRGNRTGSHSKRYTYDEKLRAVKLYSEEGFKAELVCTETGVSMSSLGAWLKQYREQGEMGLRRKPTACAGGSSWSITKGTRSLLAAEAILKSIRTTIKAGLTHS